MANRWENNGNSERLYFLGLQNHCRWWLQPRNYKTLAPWKKIYDQPRQHIKKAETLFANRGRSSERYDFSSSHIWMWELDHKESWALKNWFFCTVVLEKTFVSSLYCKEIQLVHPKGNPSLVFIGRAEAEAETPYFGHLMWTSDSLEKTLILGKTEGGRRRGWDGWMASPKWWTWVWASSRS